MIFSTRIVSSSEVTRSKPYGTSVGSNAINLSREIYLNLSSIMKSSSMMYSENPRTKFEEFMKDYNDFNEQINDLTEQEIIELTSVDEFFGSLGMTAQYPITQDITGTQRPVTAHYNKLNTRK